eukprot:6182157-Pleurochrysis_carterae.AAC.7
MCGRVKGQSADEKRRRRVVKAGSWSGEDCGTLLPYREREELKRLAEYRKGGLQRGESLRRVRIGRK